MNSTQRQEEFPEGASPLRQAAVQIHELYKELRNAGFSQREAMELLSRFLSQTLGNALEQ